MKKSLLIFTMLIGTAALTFTSCNTPEENVEDAKENVKDSEEDVIKANKDLEIANQAYLTEVAAYKIQVTENIEKNNLQLTEFKARIAAEKTQAKEDYNKKIADLEKKNSDMKMKMDNYKLEAKDNWKDFKTELDREMNEINKAFTNLAKDSTKSSN